jgi:NAD+ diphosphatase
MIHEILPHSFDNEFLLLDDVGEDDYIFHFNENSLLFITVANGLEIPRKRDFPGISDTIEKSFLFTFNQVPCFLVENLPETNDSRLIYKEISVFRTFEQKEIAWISIVGFQLMIWYSQNKFCGKCGSKTIEKSDERAITCPNCQTTVYPKISPAIIVAIVCNNKILLANNSKFRANWYSLVAGYADIGETLEEAVVREVKEEVGLDVKNIRYYKSQPWPFSGSMMIGFFADADDNQPICVDNIEITHAAWFNRGDLPNHPTNISIAGEMIGKFEEEGK